MKRAFVAVMVFCVVLSASISDSSSAVLPGFSIMATNTETGAKYETVSTETGNYTLVQLPAGIFRGGRKNCCSAEFFLGPEILPS
jgi:hypothetical protein